MPAVGCARRVSPSQPDNASLARGPDSRGGTWTIRLWRARKEPHLEEPTRPLLLSRAQALTGIQSGALSALTAAPLRGHPSALTDTRCLPVVIASPSAT